MIVALQTLVFFRQTLLEALDRFLRPYYKKLFLAISKKTDNDSEEEEDDHVFADYDEVKGVVFYPPMYAQRYAAISDCLLDERWCGKLEKVVDLGYHDMSFIKYLKDVPGIKQIFGVDLEIIPLRCSSDLFEEYTPKRENPLRITLFQGNAADPDYRLIGCDAVVAIEMIEHMLPHDLERLVHTVFGFIKPWVAIFTTPNADFNVLFKSLEKNNYRRLDHLFEWSREQFNDWCSNIVVRYSDYTVNCKGIGPGPNDTRHLGCCSQMAVFVAKRYQKQQELNPNSLALIAKAPEMNIFSLMNWESKESLMENQTNNQMLNCSTYQVKKFSKTTQNLMAKNKLDYLAHTREVVNEIKELTHMLNFKKPAIKPSGDSSNLWFNINWGENAPYWNQYYKVVRDYSYPYEVKSDETRILDLIYDELNRLIDLQYETESCTEPSKLEIPIEHLMKRVEHITTDVDKVKDLLDWNGYEIVNDVVVHTRLMVDNNRSNTSIDEDWIENETLSDYENDLPAMETTSDGCFNLPNMPGRYIRRAIDQKVRKLRSMMTADEDITSELDRVVCRLMKLAIKTSRGYQSPPPTKWMHCKLFDLLTLTEKAIERRRQHVLDNCTLRAIGYDDAGKDNEKAALEKLKRDKTGLELVNKYSYFVNNTVPSEDEPLYNDDLSLTSAEYDNDVLPEGMSLLLHWHNNNAPTTHTDRTEAWVNNDARLQQHRNTEKDSYAASDADVDRCVSNSYNFYSRTNRKYKPSIKYCTNIKKSSCKSGSSKHRSDHKDANRHRHLRKVLYTKYHNIAKGNGVKICTTNFCNFKLRTCKINRSLFRTDICKPIPDNLIKLCSPKYEQHMLIKKNSPTNSDISKRETEVKVSEMNESYDQNETYTEENDPSESSQRIDMERSECSSSRFTETDVETAVAQTATTDIDPEQALRSIQLKHIESQTIFLYDINEPSTSKGLTHVSMDVQCGPDVTGTENFNNASCTSHSDVMTVCNEGTTGNSIINTVINSADFGTSMSRHDKVYRTIMPKIKSVGIIIKDSDLKFCDNNNRSTITDQMTDVTTCTKNFVPADIPASDTATETDPVIVPLKESKPDYTRILSDFEKKLPSFTNFIKETTTATTTTTGSIETFLASSPKPLETNLANSLMTRLKLCYSGIRIRSFKSKQEYQNAFPEKASMPAQILNERTTHINQRKINSKNRKQETKLNYVISKEKKNIKNSVSGKTISKNRCKKLNPVHKTEWNENSTEQREIQMRIPKLTITKPKTLCEMIDITKVHSAQSGSRQSRQKILTKRIQTKKGVSTDLLKNKQNTEKTKKEVVDLRNKKVNKTIPVLIKNQKNCKNKINTYINLNKSIDTVQSNKVKNSKTTEEIKSDFSKMQPQVFSEFYVYQNETKSSVMTLGSEKDPTVRSPSPQSVESSTCSSPGSVETVKLRPKSLSPNSHSRLHALSPESKSITSIKSKKSQKNFRKFSAEKYEGNKENDVDQLNSDKMFLGNNANVFIAKLNNTPLQSTENSLVKRKSSKSVKRPDNFDEQRDPFVVRKQSSKSIKFEHVQSLDQEFISRDNSMDYPRSSTPINEEDHKMDICQMIENSMTDSYSVEVITPLITDIVEFSLGITENSEDSLVGIDTQTIILEQDNNIDDCLEDSLSLSVGSVKTAVENLDMLKEYDEEFCSNSIYNTINAHDFSKNTLLMVPETEVLTFHPKNSLTDSLQNTPVFKNSQSSSHSYRKESILDLYERKNALSMPVNASPLALQAFSGFSVNTEPIPGDQPDYVNQIESAAGSGTNEFNRQATSEEFFVSGRSSVTFETCSFDEDTVIPEWLFRIVNHQQVEPEEVSELGPAMLPLAEPLYDLNGNAVEPAVGSEAGAGDGRGVHSDVSQDSSGQGSSITSSDTSSGPHSEVSCTGVSSILSEALIIDPSMLTGQYTSALPLETDSVRSTQDTIGNVDPPRSSREVHHDTMALLGASDADADESSLDTDA